ncbi:MAG: TIGR03617 family F420-dependent LLM class oxidoreductase [Acidimicrobiales bacterium]|nr:TIGR03617 family F420-dependent LLM class oxidoreductase [Acidimicrobiales bacterium]
MEVVAGMSDKLRLGEVGAYARRVEALGFDTLHVPETVHDAFLGAMLALEHTKRITVRTSVALAFTRSPMVTAYAAWDLALESGGRFELGLGTQIRQNIEGRYGVPWHPPVLWMRDHLAALSAIFDSFHEGTPLAHTGPHYRLGRLQPFFRPDPVPTGPPPLWLGGVNRHIVELAGEVARGFVTHPTNSHPRYLQELCLPALDAGAALAERPRPRVIAGAQWATGRTANELAENREHHRRMLAFLYSTPAYRRTLELFGWEDLGEQLQRLTREQAWDRLHTIVTDEILDALVPQATWDELPDVVGAWYRNLADGVLLRPPEDPEGDGRFAEVVAAVRALG